MGGQIAAKGINHFLDCQTQEQTVARGSWEREPKLRTTGLMMQLLRLFSFRRFAELALDMCDKR
jgi:hypothetical protein